MRTWEGVCSQDVIVETLLWRNCALHTQSKRKAPKCQITIKLLICVYAISLSEQDHIPVMRGQWFIDGTWLPLEEEESDLIEQEHLNHFRGQHMQDTFETDLVVRTVDSKDGKQTGRAWDGDKG